MSFFLTTPFVALVAGTLQALVTLWPPFPLMRPPPLFNSFPCCAGGGSKIVPRLPPLADDYRRQVNRGGDRALCFQCVTFHIDGNVHGPPPPRYWPPTSGASGGITLWFTLSISHDSESKPLGNVSALTLFP